MSFLPAQDDDEVMTEINMTPLIDVMLVLLIVFILAVPAMHSAIPLVLPRASSTAPPQPAQPVRLDIDAQGHAYWNGKLIEDDALNAQAQQAARQEPQPVVRLSGDRVVPYERVLQTLVTLQGAGLAKVNFIAQKP
ncbi:biopolymer transporter ExbD [Limnohabitans sp. TS-CS-82]|uniref:ExbD/TolR family protein n=1 Tax=Limnohabitans sp. TS-CS-82 TaxID=2094193 RepID=UPI000CF2DFA0|nr:biopolymer transporter ExbD [Limnohabitans sp. TS-CS-82]PQA83547.1 biopolymer transporter ExbD [Limnohabitans sp. TS-CS-82]